MLVSVMMIALLQMASHHILPYAFTDFVHRSGHSTVPSTFYSCEIITIDGTVVKQETSIKTPLHMLRFGYPSTKLRISNPNTPHLVYRI
jgi:hypothetical protein